MMDCLQAADSLSWLYSFCKFYCGELGFFSACRLGLVYLGPTSTTIITTAAAAAKFWNIITLFTNLTFIKIFFFSLPCTVQAKSFMLIVMFEFHSKFLAKFLDVFPLTFF